MTPELKTQVDDEIQTMSESIRVRIVQVLQHLGIPKSLWYRPQSESDTPRGRPPKPIDPKHKAVIQALCELYPFWGYKRMAVVARRDKDPLLDDIETPVI